MKTVLFILILALCIRLAYLGDNLFFGYEQGRDFLKITEISAGNITLIGPKTDIDGLFHGALSYYVLLPFFIVLGGNPFLILVGLIALHVASIYFLYKFTKEIKGKMFAKIVILLYALSYSSAVYARWLSNPNLVPALTILMLFCLVKARKNKKLIIFAAFFWAVIFHLQVIAALILLLPLAYFLLTNKILSKKNMILSALVVLGVLSSYLLFNFKNDNILLNGLSNYLKNGVGYQAVRLDEFYNEIVDALFPESRITALIIFWFVVGINIFSLKKDNGTRFILLLFFSVPLLFILLGVSPLRHLFIQSPLFISLLVGNAIYFLIRQKLKLPALVLVLVIIGANMVTIFNRLPGSNRNFIYHAQSTYLADMKNLVDYAYKDAGGAAFSYDYYSVPYWHNDAWEYMFKWYGKWKYDYLPEPNRTKVFYVFIEPDETQPKYQEDWYRKLSETSVLLAEYSSGKLKVEKREER